MGGVSRGAVLEPIDQAVSSLSRPSVSKCEEAKAFQACLQPTHIVDSEERVVGVCVIDQFTAVEALG